MEYGGIQGPGNYNINQPYEPSDIRGDTKKFSVGSLSDEIKKIINNIEKGSYDLKEITKKLNTLSEKYFTEDPERSVLLKSLASQIEGSHYKMPVADIIKALKGIL